MQIVDQANFLQEKVAGRNKGNEVSDRVICRPVWLFLISMKHAKVERVWKDFNKEPSSVVFDKFSNFIISLRSIYWLRRRNI